MVLVGFLIFLLMVAAYLTPGLFVSRRHYRANRGGIDLDDADDVLTLALLIGFWPLYLVYWRVRRFYEGDSK